MNLNYELMTDTAQVPTRATEGAAGYDLYADEPVNIRAGGRATVSTGVKIALPPNWAALVVPRSGLAARHGVTVLNAPGLIDSDYRGEVKVILVNHSGYDFHVKPGDRIAQLVFKDIPRATFTRVARLDETERGTDGFGSTGR